MYGFFQLGDGSEDAATDAPSGDDGKKPSTALSQNLPHEGGLDWVAQLAAARRAGA